MRYNVAQLLKEEVGSTRSYQIDEEISAFEQDAPDRVKGRLFLMRTDKGILATAALKAQLPAICSRCLTPFTQPVTLQMEEECFPRMDTNTGKPLEQPGQAEGAFFIDAGNVLDLHEAVRQYSLTNGSMKPLCRPNCLGLCPTCGGDRNNGECDCETAVMDPRLAPLKQLLEKGV